jgi:hypothetical protein
MGAQSKAAETRPLAWGFRVERRFAVLATDFSAWSAEDLHADLGYVGDVRPHPARVNATDLVAASCEGSALG